MIDIKPKQGVRRAKHWLNEQIIQDVPEDIALCEFDCRKGQCRMGEWESCERRIQDLQGPQDLQSSQCCKLDGDQFSSSINRSNMADANGGTGKRQGDPEASLLSSDTGDHSNPERRAAHPVGDRGTGKRQGDAEGRLVRRVAAKPKSKK